jgi:hypothetical protein
VLSLEHDDWVFPKVTQVQLLSFSKILGSLFLQKPSYVRIEKSLLYVMRVQISIRKFVMQTMVSAPTVDGSLEHAWVIKHIPEFMSIKKILNGRTAS